MGRHALSERRDCIRVLVYFYVRRELVVPAADVFHYRSILEWVVRVAAASRRTRIRFGYDILNQGR